MSTLRDFVASCIAECNCRGDLKTSSDAEVLLLKFAEKLDADGVAKWEDRLAYTEHEPVEIVPEQTVTPVSFYGGTPSTGTQVIEQFEEGATYVVTFEGKQYECVCHGFPMSTTTILGVGNGALYAEAGYVDEYSNGEPFCLRNVSGDSGAIATEVEGTFTVSVVRLEETIKTIDPKYLPPHVKRYTLGIGEQPLTFDELSSIYHESYSGCAIVSICGRSVVSCRFKYKDFLYAFYNNADEGITINVCEPNDDGLYDFNSNTRYYGHQQLYASSVRLFGALPESDGYYNACRIDQKCVVLMSSTPDSTKRFRITVDDSGTITATEVT